MGDFDSDLDYGAVQAKLTPNAEPGPKDDSEPTLDDLEKEGGILEYTEDSKDKDTKETEDDLFPKEEEEVVDKTKKEPPKKVKEGDDDASKTKEDLLAYLRGKDGSGKTTVKIKGKDYNLEDLSPEEILNRFSLAGRAYQTMEENAAERKQLERDRQTLERAAETTQDLMRQYGALAEGKKTDVPDALKPSDMDSDEVKGLKGVAAQLYDEVHSLKQSVASQGVSNRGNQILSDINALKSEFPVASEEEVIAIITTYPNVPIREAMEASHKHYVGDDYLNRVLSARPDKLREIKEQGIKEYLTKKKTSTTIPRKPSSTATTKISESPFRKPRSFAEIEARRKELMSYLDSKYEED